MLNREALWFYRFGRIFFGKPAATFPENAPSRFPGRDRRTYRFIQSAKAGPGVLLQAADQRRRFLKSRLWRLDRSLRPAVRLGCSSNRNCCWVRTFRDGRNAVPSRQPVRAILVVRQGLLRLACPEALVVRDRPALQRHRASPASIPLPTVQQQRQELRPACALVSPQIECGSNVSSVPDGVNARTSVDFCVAAPQSGRAGPRGLPPECSSAY